MLITIKKQHEWNQNLFDGGINEQLSIGKSGNNSALALNTVWRI